MDWALAHFVYDRPHIKYLLIEHQSLGAHTDIIQFQHGGSKVYRWTHVGAQPLGFHINPQCGQCYRLKTKTPKPTQEKSGINHSAIVIRCTACKSQNMYAFPAGWDWVDNRPVKGEERGAWIVCDEIQ